MGELQVADVRAQVGLSMSTDFTDGAGCTPADHHAGILDTMLDQVVAWAEVRRPLRTD